MRSHRWVPLLVLPFLLGFGCFSTIAPDRDPNNTPGGGGGGQTWVRGQVRQFMAVGDRPLVAGIAVEVVWLANGVFREEDNAISDGNGNYSAFTTRTDITNVRVAAFKCEYDPDNPAPRFADCCILNSTCECESPWDTSVVLKVVPGNDVQQTLTINCTRP